MSKHFVLPIKKPVIGLPFNVIVAMEESKRRKRALSKKALSKDLQIKMSEGDLNAYYRACVEELGLEVPKFLNIEAEPEEHPLRGESY